jgi:hypothetical protein
MLLTAIRTHRHLRAGIDQVKIALIDNRLNPFIDEVEIDIDPFTQSSLSELDNRLNTGVRRGCG